MSKFTPSAMSHYIYHHMPYSFFPLSSLEDNNSSSVTLHPTCHTLHPFPLLRKIAHYQSNHILHCSLTLFLLSPLSKYNILSAMCNTLSPTPSFSSALLEKIADLVNDKKLEGISDLRDESDRDGIRVVVELKRDAVPALVQNNLFKKTSLQWSFSGEL